MMSQKMTAGFIAAAFLVVGLLAYVLISASDHPEAGGADGILGGDFTLSSLDGDVSLTDFRGQVVLLYFGFLSCPEVCPASMGVYQNTLNKLDESELTQVQPILISIDPARDSKHALVEFSQYFHPKIIGVTGTESQLEEVAADYGAFFEIIDSETEGSDYAFRHSSRYYVIDRQGRLVDAMRHSTTPNELVARIRQLI